MNPRLSRWSRWDAIMDRTINAGIGRISKHIRARLHPSSRTVNRQRRNQKAIRKHARRMKVAARG